MKKALRTAYLLLFTLFLLIPTGCSTVQSIDGGISFPDWFPIQAHLKVEMKVDADLALPAGDETETPEVAE